MNAKVEILVDNIEKVIIGKRDCIIKIVTSMLCGGHVLIEDVPGTGKTMLSRALAKSMDCDFRRIQFTPDLLPSDITGINFYNRKEDCFEFKKGPAFTNILLADEINRATPRTQSSLLECMEERQISEGGVTYKLDRPFMVIATQNPVETQGTFPLPEAQLDRFFMKLSVGYPSFESEVDMLKNHGVSSPVSELHSVVSREEIISAQDEVRNIKVCDDLIDYIVRITEATRNDMDVKVGVSPRGTLALLLASKGKAAVSGRDYVIPDDIKDVAVPVLSHRIISNKLAANKSEAACGIIKRIVSGIAVPSEQV